MRFCMITTFYPPYHFGGDATYVRALSEALTSRGHEVTVVHCEDSFRISTDRPDINDVNNDNNNLNIIRLKSNFGILSPLITQQTGYPGLKAAQLENIFKNRFDIVNFHNISLIGGPGILKMSRALITLYTLHEHWLLCPTHIFWKYKKKACDSRRCFMCSIRSGIPPQLWRYTSLIKSSIRTIDSFIAPSEFTAAQHREAGITNKIKVLPLFSCLDPVDYKDKSEGKLSFIAVGRVTASKGIAELLNAFSLWPDYDLHIVGDGDQLGSLKKKYKFNSNIFFHGAVPQKLLVEMYQRATALILPSLAPETFGLTIVEAFSCGVPAIVRIAGGNREIIDRSGAGFLYSNHEQLMDSILKFQNDNTLRTRLGLIARKAYEREYTESNHLDNYLKLIACIASEKKLTLPCL